jgi:hypothetical protein
MEDTKHNLIRSQEKYIRHPKYFKLIRSKFASATVAADKAKQTGVLAKPVATSTAIGRGLNRMAAYLDVKWFIWFKHLIVHLFEKKHAFIGYPSTDSGVFQARAKDGNTNNVLLAITADWGTYTPESVQVVKGMMSLQPDYTIHLGDTYYSGEEDEMNENYLDPDAPWERGPCGSFSLMGNHEMYSAATPYFEKLLPFLGVKDFTTQKYQGQKAAYFCLQTKFWNVIGIDTGYNSVGFPFFMSCADCKLEDGLIKWLTGLNLKEDNRGLIFLSHHQYCSAYEEEFYKPAEQLKPLIKDKPVLWIWGHEHRFAVYGKWQSKNGIAAYGRCIGHGGMPTEIKDTTDKEKKGSFGARATSRNLVICDKRRKDIIDRLEIGFNGYVSLQLADDKAVISYYSTGAKLTDNPALLLQETWTTNAGDLTGSITAINSSPGFKTYNSQPIDKAVSK